MLVGYPPFYDIKPLKIYKKILKSVIEFPEFLTQTSRDMIRKLLNPNQKYRLGCNDDGESIKRHPFFEGVDFKRIL